MEQQAERIAMLEALRKIADVPLFDCDDARNLANLEIARRDARALLAQVQQ